MPVAKPQTDAEFTRIILNAGTAPCIVDFSATWFLILLWGIYFFRCGPCTMIAPPFDELSKKSPLPQNRKFEKKFAEIENSLKCT